MVENNRELDIVARGDDIPKPIVICMEGRRVVLLMRSEEGIDLVVWLRPLAWRERPLKPRMSCDGADADADEEIEAGDFFCIVGRVL